MRILRQYLGGAEVIDLSTPEGEYNWVHLIVQDEEAAQDLAAQIYNLGEVLVNDNEPEFIERYLRLDEAT